MITPAPRPVTARPTRKAPKVGATAQSAQPAASSAWPVNRGGSGPERSVQTPETTMPSSCVVSMTEKASP
jgi:hypothetical protein